MLSTDLFFHIVVLDYKHPKNLAFLCPEFNIIEHFWNEIAD